MFFMNQGCLRIFPRFMKSTVSFIQADNLFFTEEAENLLELRLPTVIWVVGATFFARQWAHPLGEPGGPHASPNRGWRPHSYDETFC